MDTTQLSPLQQLLAVLVPIVLLVLSHAFAFWRGKEQYKNHPEVFAKIKAKALQARIDAAAAVGRLDELADSIVDEAKAQAASVRNGRVSKD